VCSYLTTKGIDTFSKRLSLIFFNPWIRIRFRNPNPDLDPATKKHGYGSIRIRTRSATLIFCLQNYCDSSPGSSLKYGDLSIMLIKCGSAKSAKSERLVENRSRDLPCSQSGRDIKNVFICLDICVVLFLLPGCVCGSRPAPPHLHHIQRGKQCILCL
jgi:hypothetical protein